MWLYIYELESFLLWLKPWIPPHEGCSSNIRSYLWSILLCSRSHLRELLFRLYVQSLLCSAHQHPLVALGACLITVSWGKTPLRNCDLQTRYGTGRPRLFIRSVCSWYSQNSRLLWSLLKTMAVQPKTQVSSHTISFLGDRPGFSTFTQGYLAYGG